MHEFGGVLPGQFAGGVRQPGQPRFQGRPGGGSTRAIVLRCAGQQFPAHRFQLLFHLRVPDEVHLLELVNEPDQTVERFLVNAACSRADAMEHVVAQLGRLLPQTGHALGNEALRLFPDFGRRFPGGLLPGLDQMFLIAEGQQVQTEPLRHGDLE